MWVGSTGTWITGSGAAMRRKLSGAGLVLALTITAGTGQAEGLSQTGAVKSRLALFKMQTRLLDTRLSTQYQDSTRLTPHGKDGVAKGDGVIPGYDGRYRGEYVAMARGAATKHGVPEDLFLRLVQRESGWNPNAVSPKGATGLAQLMPETASHLGVDETDPAQNLDGGAHYLRMMYDRFGSWRLALAAYNAGPIAVEEAGGVPDYDETQSYVAVILGS